MTFVRPLLLCFLLLVLALPAQSQTLPEPAQDASAGKAFGLSLVLPGLGHRYVNQGQWSGWARTYTAADVSLWLGLIGGEWHRDQLEQSYRTLASTSAGADLSGKDRTFFLNLASFESSDQYRDTMLRNRSWDRIDYVSDPAYHWQWESEADYNRFRTLRDDAESLKRRRSILIASLVANRLISGAIAARSAGRSRRAQLSAAFGAPVETAPSVHLSLRF